MHYSRRITKSLVFSFTVLIGIIFGLPFIMGLVYAIRNFIGTVVAVIWPPWFILGWFVIVTIAHYFLADPVYRPKNDNWKLPWE